MTWLDSTYGHRPYWHCASLRPVPVLTSTRRNGVSCALLYSSSLRVSDLNPTFWRLTRWRREWAKRIFKHCIMFWLCTCVWWFNRITTGIWLEHFRKKYHSRLWLVLPGVLTSITLAFWQKWLSSKINLPCFFGLCLFSFSIISHVTNA